MYDYKIKRVSNGRNNSGIYCFVSTVLSIICIFLFVTILSHNTLDDIDNLGKVLVVNNKVQRWDIIREGEKDMQLLVNSTSSEMKLIRNYVSKTMSIGHLADVEEFVSKEVKQWEQYVEQAVMDRIRIKVDNNNNNINNIKKSQTINSSDMAAAATSLARMKYHELSCPDEEQSEALPLLQFWRPITEADSIYRTPFATASDDDEGSQVKYVTFEPGELPCEQQRSPCSKMITHLLFCCHAPADVGGWNNIRMQLELVLVFAYTTGRTLVLPPDQPMYLLNKGKGHLNHHSFADFFPFANIAERMPVISMEDFMRLEAVQGKLRNQSTGQVAYPPDNKTVFDATTPKERLLMWDYLRGVGACPKWQGMDDFLVIPPSPGVNVSLLAPHEARPYLDRRKAFGAGRRAVFYDDHWHSQRLIHFISKPGMGYRLLDHYYTFILFEDLAMDRYYKRFIRDYVHYVDVIFCKAGQIISRLLAEGNGSYSSFHIRRGEFQYNNVKISAEELLQNVGHLIPAGQLVFIATDEKKKQFFDAFRTRWPQIRFLDDYADLAHLKNINPNYLGEALCVSHRLSPCPHRVTYP